VSCDPLSHQTCEIAPGIVLDARRAVWLADDRTLLLADLHLGYAWAQRHAGNLLPLHRANTLDRLAALLADYPAERLVLLGDVVHAAVALEPVAEELRRLAAFADEAEVLLVTGNHDRRLRGLLEQLALDLPLVREWQLGPHRLVHGDGATELAAKAELATAHARGGFVFCGHEHPAITLSDRVASFARCPCFVRGEGLVLLPAFSEWAAGSNLRRGSFLSPYLRAAHVLGAHAVVAGRLLDLPASALSG
jgi:putative SbcD/Mre11-related phosphoesterase